MPKINGDLFRTLVLTILAGLAVLIVSVANRDVYSKEVVDMKVRRIDGNVETVRHDIDNMQEDIRWMVRQMGGTPSVETRKDSNSSQSN